MRQDDSDDMAVIDLARPATTDVNSIVQQLHQARETGGLTVVFATYQSIDVVSKAQAILNKSTPGSCVFDLIVCDEAHRTTGVTLKDADESAFVKVHDNDFLPAAKRLYMTATPRLYTEDSKSKAKEAEAILCSMDDQPFTATGLSHRLWRGGKELLSDYKVLVLTVSDRDIPPSLQMSIANGEMEINTDDAAGRLHHALSKRMLVDEELLKETRSRCAAPWPSAPRSKPPSKSHSSRTSGKNTMMPWMMKLRRKSYALTLTTLTAPWQRRNAALSCNGSPASIGTPSIAISCTMSAACPKAWMCRP